MKGMAIIMIRITAREFIMDLKGMFRGWNLFVFVLFIGFVILMSKTGGEHSVSTLIMFFAIWSCLTMKPKLNKLHYLLPGTQNSRVYYILNKSAGVFLFNIIWYVMAIGIMLIFSVDQTKYEWKPLFCEIIPFLIAYISVNMNSGYNLIAQRKDEWNKKLQYRYYMSLGAMIFPMWQVTMLSELAKGVWYIIFTIISYLCALLVLSWQISVLIHMDTAFENSRKVEKIFS